METLKMVKRNNLNRIKFFHKKKKIIPKVILSKTGKREVIYGARALNRRFPPFLDRATQDFDIFSPMPKKDAMEVKTELNKKFKGNFFFVEEAKHKGTFKVKSRINQEGYVDYTKPDKKIPSRKIGKHRYVKLNYVKKHIRKTLKDPEAKFRWERDKDALNRILIYEKLKKLRKKKSKPKPKPKRRKRRRGLISVRRDLVPYF